MLWEDRIFLTCAEPEQKRRRVVCLSATSGKQLWTWEASYEYYRNHPHNSFAASTLALDGERAYVTWASGERAIALALDHAGRKLWERDLGAFRATHGHGTSPIVEGNTLIVTHAQEAQGAALFGLEVRRIVDALPGGHYRRTPDGFQE